MLIYIVRFFQRYAFFFSMMAAFIGYRPVLPKDSPWWLEAAVVASIFVAVERLLYKEDVTGMRADGKPGLTILAIIGLSVFYWYLILFALFLFLLLAGDSVTDWLPFGQNIDGQITIAALVLAAVVYVLGLRAAIRKRRLASD